MDQTLALAQRYLRGAQHSDGGWGYTSGNRQSFVEPTSWALLTLCEHGAAEGSGAEAAIQFLVAAQNDDGGWPNVPGMPSDMMTARAVLALADQPAHKDAVARGVDWLLRNQQADGGWGWCLGTTGFLETAAYAILALSATARLPDRKGLVEYVKGLACTDGGWCSHVPTKLGYTQASQTSITPLGVIALHRLGVTPADEALHRGLDLIRRWLAQGDIVTPYSVAVTLWAFAEAGLPAPTELTGEAVALRHEDGSWQGNAWYTAVMCYALGRA